MSDLPHDSCEGMSDEVLAHYIDHGDPLAANDPKFPDDPDGGWSGVREPLNPLEPEPNLGTIASLPMFDGD